jgi:hypothetical protein
MFSKLIFRIKFWFKKRKLKKLDPYIYEVNKNDE